MHRFGCAEKFKRIGDTVMRNRLIAILFVLSAAMMVSKATVATPAAQGTTIAGTAGLSGTVDSTAPFKAAQVFIRNVDKRILYMVYTNAGQFRAVALFPGAYEVSSGTEGLLNYRASALRFSRQDREDLLAYLVKHFGPDAKPRAVRIDQEMPFEEAKLGKAMYIEYYLPPDPPGKGTNAPEYNKLQAAFVGHRTRQNVRFDYDGDVWLTGLRYPLRPVKLHTLTGVDEDFA